MKSFKWNVLNESFLNEIISMESFKWNPLNEVFWMNGFKGNCLK